MNEGKKELSIPEIKKNHILAIVLSFIGCFVGVGIFWIYKFLGSGVTFSILGLFAGGIIIGCITSSCARINRVLRSVNASTIIKKWTHWCPAITIIIAGLGIAFSCVRIDLDNKGKTSLNPTSESIHDSLAQKESQNEIVDHESNIFLGYGVDVLGLNSNNDFPSRIIEDNLCPSRIIDLKLLDNKTSLIINEIIKDRKQTKKSNTLNSVEKITADMSNFGLNYTNEVKPNYFNLDNYFEIKYPNNPIYQEFSYCNLTVKYSNFYLNSLDSLSEVLSKSFLNDVESVKSFDDCKSVFKKYGSHLQTGFTLGRAIEITNLYSYNEFSTVEERKTISFSDQIDSLLRGKKFREDIKDKFTSENQIDSFRLRTYPSSTIDLDDFNQILPNGNQDINYRNWLFGADETSFDQLTIVGMPEEAKILPIWNLLPNDAKYKNSREMLIESFLKINYEKSLLFNNKYADLHERFKPYSHNRNNDFSINVNGFYFYTGDEENHCSKRNYESIDEYNKNEPIKVSDDTYFKIDFNYPDLKGLDYEWKIIGNSDAAEVIDKRLGIFKANGNYDFSVGLFETLNNKNTLVEGSKYNFAFENTLLSKDNDGNYIISTANDLKRLINNPELASSNEASFKLYADIDLNMNDITAIGGSESCFNGTFDGNYHTIKNFKLLKTGTYCGLFGENKGVIKNLFLEDVKLDSFDADIRYAGALASKNTFGEIYNCKVRSVELNLKDELTKNSEISIGGLIGYNENFVSRVVAENVTINVTKNYRAWVGGLIGRCDKTSSKREVPSLIMSMISYVDISVSGKCNSAVGGLIGWANAINCEDCVVKNNLENSIKMDNTGNGDTQYGKSNAGGALGRAIVENGNTYPKTLKRVVVNNMDNIESGGANGRLVGVYLNTTNPLVVTSDANVIYSKCTINISEGALNKNVANGSPSYDNKSIKVINGQFNEESLSNFEYIASVITDKDNLNVYSMEGYAPRINNKDIVDVKIDINEEKTKTLYSRGESFELPEVRVTSVLNDGEIKEFIDYNNYSVDYQDFKKDVQGSYEIKINSYSKVVKYNVEVFLNEVTEIYINETGSHSYTEGLKTIDDSNFDLIAIYDNGTTGKVNPDSIEIVGGEIKIGTNKVLVKYQGFTVEYYVEGVGKIVDSIEILNKNEIENSTYNYSDLDKIISKLVIVAHHKNFEDLKLDNDSLLLVKPYFIKAGKYKLYFVYNLMHFTCIELNLK